MARAIVGWGWLAVLGGLASSSVTAADRPPNIVLIVADDLGWGDVGFNSRTEWATPQIDRLAARGVVLSRCYAGSPVCAPSRGALLTGRDPIHNGVDRNDADLPASEVTIAEALNSQGYTTAVFGKWHRGRPAPGARAAVHPLDQGFDRFVGFTDAVHAWEKFPSTLWDGRQRVSVEGYADDLFTDRAVAFVSEPHDRPFFLYLPLTAPHFGIEAPVDEVDRHRGRFPEADPAHPLNATYAAMVTRLDRQVGRVLDALDQNDLAGQTIVVFTSDNGATFEAGNLGTSAFHDSNRPFRGQKRTLWEGGLRVPAVVSWPGAIPSGVTHDAPVRLTDLLPTLVAVAGGAVDPSWAVDGANLLDSWTKAAPYPDRTLFWEWRQEGAQFTAALHGRLKLLRDGSGKPELYDVVADPAERRDVAAMHPEAVESLGQALDAWLATAAIRP